MSFWLPRDQELNVTEADLLKTFGFVGWFEDPTRLSDLDIIIAKVSVGSSDDEILQSLLAHDQTCNSIRLTDNLVDQLFHRFKTDWKSALGVFRLEKGISGINVEVRL
ncbi:hypothetical protein ACE6H2_010553 [Prunus campanulata]